MKRVIATLICLLLCLSMFGCFRKDQPQKVNTDPESIYYDIISQYTTLLTAKRNGETLPNPDTSGMDEGEAAVAEALYGIVGNLKDAQSAENMGYGFKDMDGNGIPELILLTRYTSVFAIFTISEDAPILLEVGYDSRNNISFATGNRFFIARNSVNGNIEEIVYYSCRVAGEKMAYDSVYGAVYDRDKKQTVEYFQIADGNRTTIQEDAFNELFREQKKVSSPEYSYTCKLLAPRIHFPLKDAQTSDGLPIADFSSYAAIRETHQKIAVALDKFDLAKWSSGGYDDLFAFPDDQSFEYYTRLLYATYLGGGYAGGYDEIDLNGDGQDELVLLNEDYRIKAIFTQKGGIPVLLDAFGYETCWLDDNGRIHVDNEQYYELEYRLYEFTKNEDFNLIYSILVADNGNRYLTKDGKTEQITIEQSLELYHNDYCRYVEPFEPYEQTRNVSQLTYTPLNESTEYLFNQAEGQTWHKYAKLEKTTGKNMARSNTFVTFERINDTQIKMSVNYRFTFSYPDPDHEQYMLDDTTESSLEITAVNENGVVAFEEKGIKGKIEFGQKFVWIIIEESTDSRFPVGHHCYGKASPNQLIG